MQGKALVVFDVVSAQQIDQKGERPRHQFTRRTFPGHCHLVPRDYQVGSGNAPEIASQGIHGTAIVTLAKAIIFPAAEEGGFDVCIPKTLVHLVDFERDGNVGMTLYVFPDLLDGIVFGHIVDHDDLVRAPGHTQYRDHMIERVRDELRFVVATDRDREIDLAGV